ncbi:translation initiation factor IF-2-like [Trachypithecus francoisi]|uniref:translation initiation factor IF-2-like n=1 Tax=Trachypithecus francoisi TaxID=54180 RepID=UPI00141B41E5|nr:translation initiation factor IF-2-like [Trachypithecus francoisi]
MGRGPAVHSGRLGSLDLTASTTGARTRSGGGFQCSGVIRRGAVNPPFPARSSARSRAPSPSQQSCHSRPTLGSQERLELGDGLQWLRSPGPAGRLLAAVSARSRPRSLETFGEAWAGGWEERLSSRGTNPPAAPAPLLRLPVRPSCSLPPSPAPASAGRLPPRVAGPGPRAPQPRPPGLSACAQVAGASRSRPRGLTARRTQVPAASPSSPNLARSEPLLDRRLPGSPRGPGAGAGAGRGRGLRGAESASPRWGSPRRPGLPQLLGTDGEAEDQKGAETTRQFPQRGGA